MNNNQNNGCGCNCNPKPENIDIQMDVCDRNINMLPMLQTYTTKVLQPNLEGCCKKNVLTQEMLSCENYKYVIKWDFDLDGKTIIVPDGCILEFDGGSLKNGTIVGNNTGIEAGLLKVFDADVTLSGTWNVEEAYPEWFDVSDAASTRNAIQKAINISDHVVLKGQYDVQNSVFNASGDMYEQRQLIINGQITEDYITVGGGKTIEITGKVKATSPLTDLFRVVGDNTLFCGGGVIEGCGIVNDWNSGSSYSTHEHLEWRQWLASLIRISGSSNKIENLQIYNPTTVSIYIKHSSVSGECFSNNEVSDCIIGGGLVSHTPTITIDGMEQSFTVLMGIFNECSNTIVENNRFVPYDGKHIYSALYCTYQDSPISYVFKNNYVEKVLEHAIYSYADNGIIEDNYVVDSKDRHIQLFCRHSVIRNNKFENTLDFIVRGSTIVSTNAIICQYDNNLIENNTFINVTKQAIHLSDLYIIRPGVKMENNIIQNNNILMYYGYNDAPEERRQDFMPIEVFTYREGINHLIIKDNIIKGTHLVIWSYTGVINIAAEMSGIVESGRSIENINISGNQIINVPQVGINLNGGDTEDYSTYRNVIIKNNMLIGCCNLYQEQSTDYMRSIYVKNAERVIISENIVKRENEDCLVNIVTEPNVKEQIITGNYIYGGGQSTTFIKNLDSSIIRDNYANGKTRGLVTLASGTNETVVFDVNINYDNASGMIASAKFTPLNDAARALQNSEHYPVFVSPVGSLRYFRIATNDATLVEADCLFEWEIVYVDVV